MKPRTFAVCVTLFCGLVLGAFGLASAGAGTDPARNKPVRISSLTEPFLPSGAQRRELRQLRGQLRRRQSASIAATVQLENARPVPLPQGLGNAWVASAPDGGVCTYIPDPLGGFGSSCANEEDLRSGGAITVLGGTGELNERAIVVLVVPDGGPTPIVTSPDGTQHAAPVPGVGAAVVPEESRLQIGGVSLRVPNFDAH